MSSIRPLTLALVLAFGLADWASAQSVFAKELQAAYDHAPNFSSKKEAFRRLENFYRAFNVDSALLVCQNFRAVAEREQPNYVPFVDTRIASNWVRKLDFEKASNLLFPILERAIREKNDSLRASALLNLSALSQAQKNWRLAIERASEAAVLHEKFQNWRDLCADLNNIGISFTNMKNDSAQLFFNKTLEISAAHNLPDIRGTILMNQGANAHRKEDFARAIELYKQAAELFKKANEPYRLCFATLNIGHALRKMKKWTEARPFYEEAMPICESCGNLEGSASIWLGMTDVFEGMGDYKSALDAEKKLSDFEQKLNEQIFNRSTQELETKYKTQQNEAEIAQKNLQIERQKSQRNLIIGAALLALAALGGWFQFNRNRQRIRQKEAQLVAQLEHAEADRLRELDRLKSTFFANISHEFRTPLTLILSPLDQILNGSLVGDLRKQHGIMARNARRLLELVNQLLDLSRLEAGKMKVEAVRGHLVAFVRAVAFSFESLAVQKQIQFTVEVPEREIEAPFDRDKLEKIIGNLLSNAFKFTPDEGRISLKMSVEKDEKTALISVADSGIGIPTAQLPHLFERFFQLQNASDLQAGSGIGLALTKELVELHHAQILVESREGEGSIFSLRWPLDEAVFSKEELVEASAATAVLIEKQPVFIEKINERQPILSLNKDGKDTALIVEDNDDVRQFIREQLAGKFHILEATNGAAGLQKAQNEMPALVITDLMMPEMDGLALTRALKTDLRTSHIPVIVLTAKAATEEKIEGFHTGADAYLTKPFDARELVAQAENLIRQRRSLREKFSQTGLHPSEIAVTSVDEAFLQKIRQTIEENMDDETFGVVELAQKVALSRSQLHRKLTAVTGHGPNEIIRNLRLERAHDLLEKQAGNASEVAFRVGFNSLAYFSKTFSDHFGYSPSEVRGAKG